jgi:hypothetical protein
MTPHTSMAPAGSHWPHSEPHRLLVGSSLTSTQRHSGVSQNEQGVRRCGRYRRFMNIVFILLAVVAFATALPSADTSSSLTPTPATQGGDATTNTRVPIVAVGCVNRASQDGSLAGTSAVPPATPETAATLANSSESTNGFMLNGATKPDASSEARALASSHGPSAATEAAYVLDGKRPEIERHAGHRVEVTGILVASNNTGGTSAHPSMKSNVAHIQVASIRMIATTCKGASSDPR